MKRLTLVKDKMMNALKGINITYAREALHEFAREELHDFAEPKITKEKLYGKGDLVDRYYSVGGYSIRFRFHDKNGVVTSINIEEEPRPVTRPMEGDFYILRTDKQGKRTIMFCGYVKKTDDGWAIVDILHKCSLDYAIRKFKKEKYAWIAKIYQSEKEHAGYFGEETAKEVFGKNYLFGAEFVGKHPSMMPLYELNRNTPDGCYFCVDISLAFEISFAERGKFYTDDELKEKFRTIIRK